MGLYKPVDGENGWGDSVSANFDAIDDAMPMARGGNLITNSRLGVYSCYYWQAQVGNPINVSAWSGSGTNFITCTTGNTQGLKVGKLVNVTSGDASLQNCPHMVAELTENQSFSFYLQKNAGGANPGAITCYEVTMGGTSGAINGTGDAMDGFNKDATLAVYREWMGDHANAPAGAGFYGGKLVKGSNNLECLYYSRFADAIAPTWPNRRDPNFVAQLRGLPVVFGVYIKAPSGAPYVEINDGVTATDSAVVPADNAWHLVQVAQVISPLAEKVEFKVCMNGVSGNICYIAIPVVKIGTYLGANDMQPITGEILIPDTRIIPRNWESANFGSSAPGNSYYMKIEGECGGQIPKGCRGMEFEVEGVGTVAQDHIAFYQSDGTAPSPYNIGPILSCQVANQINFAYGTVMFSKMPNFYNEDSIYVATAGSGTWTVSMNVGRLFF